MKSVKTVTLVNGGYKAEIDRFATITLVTVKRIEDESPCSLLRYKNGDFDKLLSLRYKGVTFKLNEVNF